MTSVHDRQNLHILPNSPVVRLAMDGTAVQGIVVRRNGREETIAAGEVILSAGAFNSPRLLMLSGIGPAAELEQLGIKVRTDLPVGKNFVDHLPLRDAQPVEPHVQVNPEAEARHELRPAGGPCSNR